MKQKRRTFCNLMSRLELLFTFMLRCQLVFIVTWSDYFAFGSLTYDVLTIVVLCDMCGNCIMCIVCHWAGGTWQPVACLLFIVLSSNYWCIHYVLSAILNHRSRFSPGRMAHIDLSGVDVLLCTNQSINQSIVAWCLTIVLCNMRWYHNIYCIVNISYSMCS